MVRIVLTGGGTAGHVMPHIAMLPLYQKEKWECYYIGGNGVERELANINQIPFFTIQTGKLRRYLSFENFLDIFKIFFGFIQSCYFLLKIKPSLVFSKGGFVSVPVAYAAWILRIPVVSHESDLTPGLANKILKPICKMMFFAFPETIKHLNSHKSFEVGIPVRAQLFDGNKSLGLSMCGFGPSERKTILVMGGSLGAERINLVVKEALPSLLIDCRVIHITGKGKRFDYQHAEFKSFEFVNNGLEHLFALADVVVSRAGANSLFEMKALKKSMLLIPLEIGSRGDQVDNARAFADKKWAHILREKCLTSKSLIEEVRFLLAQSSSFRTTLEESEASGPSGEIILKKLKILLK